MILGRNYHFFIKKFEKGNNNEPAFLLLSKKDLSSLNSILIENSKKYCGVVWIKRKGMILINIIQYNKYF